jgi:hypothetical protein
MIVAMEAYRLADELTRRITATLGGKCGRYVLADRTRKFEIGMIAAPGKPEAELTSLVTVGLSQTVLTGTAQRLELAGIFPTDKEGCREVLAAAAFKVMRTHQAIQPGTVQLNCLHDWYPKANVPHLYFVEAEHWNFPQLQPIDMGSFTVKFLQALPITEAEKELVEQQGGMGLESLLLGAAANLWDLRRASVV